MSTTALVAPAVATPGVEVPSHVGRPLTERVLDRLPGPRLAWLVLWGLSPFAAYELVNLIWGLPNYLGVAANLAFGLSNLIGLWAAGRLAWRVGRLEPTLERLMAPADLTSGRHPFRWIGRLGGPLVLSAIGVLTWDFVDFVAYPSVASAFVVGTVFVGQLGIYTFLWVYGVTLFGLDRIGRRHLRLEPFTYDPTLGLKPLGSLAFESFLLFATAAAAPVAFVLGDVRGVVIGIGTVTIVTALFVLSAFSLHRTLVTAKADHVREARRLVGEILRRVQTEAGAARSTATLERALARKASSLAVAAEIERRALGVQEWPFDAAIVRAVAAILTSVTAVVVARLLLSRLGM